MPAESYISAFIPSSSAGLTRLPAQTTRSALSRSFLPFTVINSGSPAPAPIKYTFIVSVITQPFGYIVLHACCCGFYLIGLRQHRNYAGNIISLLKNPDGFIEVHIIHPGEFH